MDLYTMRSELNSGKSIYDLAMRVTYYARVSTDKDEQAHSLRNQIEYYGNFITNNPNWTYIEGYIDEGLSGTSVNKRDSFLRMIEDARLRKFDFVITKEISRFSRNTLDSIKYTQELLSCGVGVLFQSDNINTLLPDSELRLTIMSSIAQDEVRKISERIRFGFQQAIDKGVVLGNNRIWGYTKQDGKLVIDEEQAKIVRLMFELYAVQNLGIRTISAHLAKQNVLNSNGKPFSFTTIRNILVNPKYKGYYCGNKTHKYDYRSNARKVFEADEWLMYKDEENVPPIVSEELWDKANAILALRSEKMSGEDRTSYQNKYAYSGKIFCAEHGLPYYRALYRYKSGDKEIWRCKRYSERGKAGCESPAIYTAELNAILTDCYNFIIQDRAKIIRDLLKLYSSLAQKSRLKDDIAKLKAESDAILRRKDKLLDLSISGKLSGDEFEERNDRFNAEIDGVRMRIAGLEQQARTNAGIGQSVETLRRLIATELDFEDGFDNSIIDALLEKVEVCKTGQKNLVQVRAYFKVLDESRDYTIKRGGKESSVCYAPYI